MRVTYQLVGGGDIKLKHAYNKPIWMSWVYHELNNGNPTDQPILLFFFLSPYNLMSTKLSLEADLSELGRSIKWVCLSK